MMPLWVLELAEWFWRRVGEVELFPRRLRAALDSGAFDVTVTETPRLTVHQVENRLAFLGVHSRSGEPDRPLRACVAARGGAAWIFLERDDPPQEKVASTAHEVAHFLRHCLQPRRRAVDALGEGILAVLDGRREPTPAERCSSVLRGLKLDVHVHYLRRDVPQVRTAEDEADLLAWQLLAPVEEVLRRAGDEDDLDQVRALLMATFGLPATMADDYADWLCPEVDESPVVTKLANVMNACRDRAGAGE
jgi:hypothetical protein